jgi:hypothetical protein
MCAGLPNRYRLAQFVDPLLLVLNEKDRTSKILDTLLRRGRLLEAISLAYHEPLQNMPLGDRAGAAAIARTNTKAGHCFAQALHLARSAG